MFMPWFVSILGVILITVAIILLIWDMKKGAKIDVLPNAKFVLNISKSKFTDGYQLGLIAKNGYKERMNGTFYLEYFPIDGEQGKNLKRPALQKVVVAKGNLTSMGNRREIIVVSSENPADYPERILNSPFGEALQKKSMMEYIKKTFGESFSEMTSSVARLQVEFAGGEVTSQTIGKLLEQVKKFAELSKLLEPKEPGKGGSGEQ